MSHRPLPANEVPRHLGYILGLVTATDFISSSSVLLTSEHIRGGVDATPTDFLFILTAYAVAAMLVIACIDRLGRRWHYRDLMLCGLGLFVAGALAAACCEKPNTLALARLVQGVGAGGLFTMSRVYLQLAVPTSERAKQLKGFIFSLLGSSAPISWIATRLVQDFNWQAVFVLQALFGLVALLLTAVTLKSEGHTPSSLGYVDWPMTIGFSLGTILLLHSLEDMQVELAGAIQSRYLLLAMLALVFAGWRLWQHHDPLLNPKVIQGRRFMVGLGFYCLYYLINGATSFIFPKLFESGLNLPVEQTGALLSYAAVVTVLLLPLYFFGASRLGDRRRVIAAGFAIAAISLYWMSSICTTTTPEAALLGALTLKGIFPILGVIQIAGLTYRDIPHEDFAHAYALKNIGRQLASVFAAGLANQLWQFWSAQYRSDLVGGLNPVDGVALGVLSGMVDQQVAVLVGNHLLLYVAVLCLLGIPLVLLQKAMR